MQKQQKHFWVFFEKILPNLTENYVGEVPLFTLCSKDFTRV